MPTDPGLLTETRDQLECKRLEKLSRQEAVAAKRDAQACCVALRRLKSLLASATGRGRWIKRRVGRLFDLAVSLGFDAVADYVVHRPWLARSKPAERRRAR